VRGRAVDLRSPAQAQGQGIAVMYQETSLYPDLSVLENLFVGHQPLTRFGLIDWRRMRREGTAIFRRLGIGLPLDAKLDDLTKAEMQIAEIAKALLRRADLLIMDEPTAALSEREVERLFAVIRNLCQAGTGIIYISHRLNEITRVADRVTVLRDGARAAGGAITDLSAAEIVHMTLGRTLELYPRRRRKPGPPALEVAGLCREGAFQDIGFCLHQGEILALTGLLGAGRTEVALALAGIDPLDAGCIRIAGMVPGRGAAGRAAAGLALLPEDRARQGLVLPLPVRANLGLAALRLMSRLGVIDRTAERDSARRLIERLDIRPPRPEVTTSNLSGGNQQKVALGKLLATRPRVLVLDEPTQGVDVGARAEIHRLIESLVEEGLAVLLISSDLPEVLGLADRILVMRGGRIVAEMASGCSAAEVMLAAGGGRTAADGHAY
jgi:rhamnose transport system ATP-binding protein